MNSFLYLKIENLRIKKQVTTKLFSNSQILDKKQPDLIRCLDSFSGLCPFSASKDWRPFSLHWC